MGEYGNLEHYTKQFIDICEGNDVIPLDLYEKYGVKRGLRDKDGNGVLSGLTNISRIDAFEMVDGRLQRKPCC